jgi:ATP-dependent Clp endopeptidase proteolytic subunit ClpP
MDGHIFIEGVIDDKMFASVKQQLEANISADKLIVHMASPGGSVYQGYKIYHKLRSLNIPKEGIIEGECMSIATLCIMACDTITALNPTRYMIHLPYMGLEGNSSDLENGAKELQMIEQEMIQVYKAKTKLNEEQIRQMMKDETYMDANQAKTYGFVDTVDNRTLKAYATGKRKHMTKNIFDNLGERLALAFKDVFGEPKAMDVTTDKGVIQIDTTDGVVDGKAVTVNGQPAPDGEYALPDGKLITVTGGVVSSVVEAAPPPPPAPAEDSAEDKLKKMEAEMTAIKAENEQLKAAKATEEQKVVATQEQLTAVQIQNTKAREAMASFQKEVDDLKKKTIGSDTPPAGPTDHKREPKGEDQKDYWQEETQAFLKEFVPHLLKSN